MVANRVGSGSDGRELFEKLRVVASRSEHHIRKIVLRPDSEHNFNVCETEIRIHNDYSVSGPRKLDRQIDRRAGFSDAALITQGPENIGFISGGSGIHELARMTREQIMNLTARLQELDELADIIIIDTGAGIADSVLEFVAASAEVLLVVTPEPTSIT